MTTETPTRTTTLQDRIVDALREPGLDVAAVRKQVEAVGRKRRLLARSGMAAAVVVALLGSVVFLAGGDDPDEIKADRGRPTSTLPAASTTVLTQVAESTVPVTPQISAAPSLVPAPAPTTTAPRSAAPPTVTSTAPTTTAPPANQPLDISARVLGAEAPGGVRAGRTATVEVSWSDPDNADPSGPRLTADFGDDRVHILPGQGGRPACHARGQAPSGVVRISFRYATPGPHTIRIRAATCEGQGDFAEAVEKELPITVSDPLMDDGSRARVVMAYSTATGYPPDDATATLNGTYLPPRPGGLNISPKSPRYPRVHMTLLLVPVGASGELRLSWAGGPCVSGALDEADMEVLVGEARNDC